MDVELREVTAETVRAVCRLDVSDSQRAYVASVAVSIAQAHFESTAAFRAVYADDQPVGFILCVTAISPRLPIFGAS
jgi:diamine N-acetyltransferase